MSKLMLKGRNYSGGGGEFDTSIIADDFNSTTSYAVGDYCIYDGSFYKCTTAHTGAWDVSDFDETQVSDEFGSTDIDGSTVTPTDDVGIWLECAGLHQSYTTLNEVLADSAVLSALMASTNAVDYLVRSTTWASTICANETAMNCIGVNDYCADILSSNSTWATAIGNSAYSEEVWSALVPKMTSNTTPSGECISDSIWATGREGFYAFDNDSATAWLSKSLGGTYNYYIGYKFTSKVSIFKIRLQNRNIYPNAPTAFTLQGSDDLLTWNNIQNFTRTNTGVGEETTHIVSNSNKYLAFRILITSHIYSGSDTYTSVAELQFYGRGEQPVVDTKADISAIGTEEAGSTASRDYKYGEHFYKNGKFCTCTASSGIAQGATFTLGTNYVEGTVADVIAEKGKAVLFGDGIITSWTNKAATIEISNNNIDLRDYQEMSVVVLFSNGTNVHRYVWQSYKFPLNYYIETVNSGEFINSPSYMMCPLGGSTASEFSFFLVQPSNIAHTFNLGVRNDRDTSSYKFVIYLYK